MWVSKLLRVHLFLQPHMKQRIWWWRQDRQTHSHTKTAMDTVITNKPLDFSPSNFTWYIFPLLPHLRTLFSSHLTSSHAFNSVSTRIAAVDLCLPSNDIIKIKNKIRKVGVESKQRTKRKPKPTLPYKAISVSPLYICFNKTPKS